MSDMTPRTLGTFCCSITSLPLAYAAEIPGMPVRYLKAAMTALGHCGPHVRDPHVPLTAGELTRVAKRLAELRIGESEKRRSSCLASSVRSRNGGFHPPYELLVGRESERRRAGEAGIQRRAPKARRAHPPSANNFGWRVRRLLPPYELTRSHTSVAPQPPRSAGASLKRST